jgi:flagellar biosynthetic protein FlhB
MHEEKSELPSKKTKRKLKKAGSSPKSLEIVSAFFLTLCVIFFVFFGPWFHQKIVKLLQFSLTHLNHFDWSELYQNVYLPLMVPLFLFFMGAAGVTVLLHLIQSGWVWSWKFQKPKKCSFSLFERVFQLVKCATLLAIPYFSFSLFFERTSGEIFFPIFKKEALLFKRASILLVITLVFLLFFSIFDWFYQKWKFEKNIRMTRGEKKDEMRDEEGNPLKKKR